MASRFFVSPASLMLTSIAPPSLNRKKWCAVRSWSKPHHRLGFRTVMLLASNGHRHRRQNTRDAENRENLHSNLLSVPYALESFQGQERGGQAVGQNRISRRTSSRRISIAWVRSMPRLV